MSRLPPGMAGGEEPLQLSVDRDTPISGSDTLGSGISQTPASEGLPACSGDAMASDDGEMDVADDPDELGIVPRETGISARPTSPPRPREPVAVALPPFASEDPPAAPPPTGLSPLGSPAVAPGAGNTCPPAVAPADVPVEDDQQLVDFMGESLPQSVPADKVPLDADLESVATTAASMPGGSRGIQLDDPPMDLTEEVPGEPPTLVPMSASISSQPSGQQTVTGHLREVTSASTPFAPPLRSSSSPRAEAFLGRPIALPVLPAFNPGDLEAARWLMTHRRYEKALEKLGMSLVQDRQVPNTVETSILRFRCLVALKRYQAAAEEAAKISSTQGDATPFEVRLLAAHLPFLLNSADAVPTLGMLQELAQRTRSQRGRQPQVAADGADEVMPTFSEWLQVLRTLSHVALAAGHGDVALTELKATIDTGSSCTPLQRSRLQSLLGRHCVSAGDTAAASQAFERARQEAPEDRATALLDRGLLAVGEADYAAAKAHYAEASAVAISAARSDCTAVDQAVSAENNLAVCRLYTKELRQGVQGLEAFIRRDPAMFLRSSVAQNLSALYEFLPDSANRRVVLRELAAAFNLQDLDAKSFEPA